MITDTEPLVDVLSIVDNSLSMEDEQAALAANFEPFIGYLVDSDADWHVGVISTDMEDPSHRGKLREASGGRWIDRHTPAPEAVFAAMANVGLDGSFDEMGRRAAHRALTNPLLQGYNAGFYRPEASLHLVVNSDEDDSSGNQPRLQEFIQFLRTLKSEPSSVTFSSIVGPVGGCATADAGTAYLAVTAAIGGLSTNICTADWAGTMEALGLQAAGLTVEFFLSETPIAESLEVEVIDGDHHYWGVNTAFDDPADFPEYFGFHWVEARNSIVLEDFVPEPGAQVHISYELAAAPHE